MNRIDFVLILILSLYAFLGFRRGFLAVALDWAGLATGAAVALWLSPAVGDWITRSYGLVAIAARILAFLGLLLAVRIVWSLVSLLIWRRIPRAARNSAVNRAAGILPGLLEGAVIAALGLVALAALPLPIVPRREIAQSLVGAPLLKWGVATQAGIQQAFGGTLSDLITFRTAPLKEGESIELPFRTTQAAPEPEAESAMLEMVNTERRRRGLKPLRADDRLREVGRRHSQDMLARGYFSHIDPNGRGPFDRLRAAKIGYLAAGENLAFAPTVQVAHEGLMDSPGHRANILNPAYGRVGIGALRARPYGLMFTQVFRN